MTNRVWHFAFAAAMMALISACASKPPVEEVRAFKSAVDLVSAASLPLFDNLAVAERKIAKSAQNSCSNGGVVRGHGTQVDLRYCVEYSQYFAEGVDPPGTATFRRGALVIGSYADVLVLLAEGRNLSEVNGQLQGVVSQLSGLLTIVGAATGNPAGPVAAKAGLSTAASALAEALKPLVAIKNKQELKRLVIEHADKVRALIDAMKNSAPAIYKVLAAGPRRKASSREGLANKAVFVEQVKLADAYRKAVSTYVVMLDRLKEAFNILVIAAQQPRNKITLARIRAESEALKSQAEAWRRFFSTLSQVGNN